MGKSYLVFSFYHELISYWYKNSLLKFCWKTSGVKYQGLGVVLLFITRRNKVVFFCFRRNKKQKKKQNKKKTNKKTTY